VLVVDDQPWFRGVMCDVVAATQKFRLIGEAESGEAAIEAVDRVAPALVVLDKRMPGMGGVAACRTIKERHPGIAVLICSVEDPDAAVIQASGADAFIRKQELSPRRLEELWREHANRSIDAPVSRRMRSGSSESAP
jgi:DNA-binding NarL/FixJ family response regulator